MVLRMSANATRPDKLVRLKLKSPFAAEVFIREFGTDLTILQEVLFKQVYGAVSKRLAKSPETIIDLGANIGMATLYLANQFSNSRILAVEPEPANFGMLNKNVQSLIRAGRCKTLRAAVWNEDGDADLGSAGEGVFWSFYAKAGGNSASAVPARSMNSLVRESGFETVDLVKVDIEGGETQMFRGNLDWLDRVRAIAIEFHGESRRDSNFDRILSSFEISDLNPHTTLAIHR
jgi:FkbM family methyltransferase